MTREDGGRLALAAVLVGTFVGTVNNSVANVAVIEVVDDFEVGVDAGVWFVTGYVLAFAVLMPAAGRLADAVGARRVYVAGMAGFAVASVAVAVAPTYPVAAVARVLQGVCNAPVLPTVMMTIAAVFPPGLRGRAMGTWAAVNGIAIAAGPSLGGFVTDALGWRAVFWLDVPMAVAAVVLARRYVPAVQPRRVGALDAGGGALLTLGLVAVMVGLSQGGSWLGLLGVGALLLVAFWRRAHRVASPFVAVDILRNRRFAVLATLAGLQMVVLYGVLFVVPLLLVERFGRGVGAAGALVVVLPLSMIVAGPTMGHLADRFGTRTLAAAGAGLLVVASVAASAGVAYESVPWLLAALIVLGAGVSAIQAPTAVGVADEIDEAGRGAAMGLFHTIRFVAGVLGTAGAAAVLTAGAGDGRSAREFLLTFGVLGAVAVVAVAMSRLVPRHRLDHVEVA